MEPKGTGRAWNSRELGMPVGWEEKLLLSSSESRLPFPADEAPEAQEDAAPHPGSWPSAPQPPQPLRPSLQALGPPIWAVSAGRSHPELSEWMLRLSAPTPGWSSGCGQGLWPWIALTWASVTPGSPLEPWGTGWEKEKEHRGRTPRQKQQVQGVQTSRHQAEHLCGFCCGIWARHPHSLGFSAASGQEYFRDHRRLIPCSCPRRGSLSYGPPFTLTAS